MGQHRELMEKNAYYRELVANQQIILPEDGPTIAASRL